MCALFDLSSLIRNDIQKVQLLLRKRLESAISAIAQAMVTKLITIYSLHVITSAEEILLSLQIYG